MVTYEHIYYIGKKNRGNAYHARRVNKDHLVWVIVLGNVIQ